MDLYVLGMLMPSTIVNLMARGDREHGSLVGFHGARDTRRYYVMIRSLASTYTAKVSVKGVGDLPLTKAGGVVHCRHARLTRLG